MVMTTASSPVVFFFFAPMMVMKTLASVPMSSSKPVVSLMVYGMARKTKTNQTLDTQFYFFSYISAFIKKTRKEKREDKKHDKYHVQRLDT